MKNILCILAVFCLSASYAQKTDRKIKEVIIKVPGVCGMCENRIESAALRVKGVKTAEWDKKSQDLKVVYSVKKTELAEVHHAVAENGHDTPNIKADTANYVKLPNCCRYRDGAKCSD